MKCSQYHFTPIEQYVYELYQNLSIFDPYQLDMMNIATKLNIRLHFADVGSTAVDRNGTYSIIIDRRLNRQQQWQDFGHELCHVLLHAGNQYQLPRSFVEYQENKARNFAYHFCIPTFMLEKIPLPPRQDAAIQVISETFNVEPLFAAKRLERWLQQQESFYFYEKLHNLIAEN